MAHTLLGRLDNVPYAHGVTGDGANIGINQGAINGAAISPDRQFAIVRLISAGAETRTISAPRKTGKVFTLNHVVDGGDIVVTFPAAFNAAGNTIVTFSAIGQWAKFESLERGNGVFEYKLIASNGCALS